MLHIDIILVRLYNVLILSNEVLKSNLTYMKIDRCNERKQVNILAAREEMEVKNEWIS